MNCPLCASERITVLGKVEPSMAIGRTEAYVYECRDCSNDWEVPCPGVPVRNK